MARHRVAVVAIAVGAVALTLATVLGGFRAAASDVPMVTVGTRVSLERWGIRVDGPGRVVKGVPFTEPALEGDEQTGEQWIVVPATVRMTGDESADLGVLKLRMKWGTRSLGEHDGQWRLRDPNGYSGGMLFGPGITERVMLGWKVRGRGDGDQVTLAIGNEIFIEESALVGGSSWFHRGVAAHVRIPLERGAERPLPARPRRSPS